MVTLLALITGFEIIVFMLYLITPLKKPIGGFFNHALLVKAGSPLVRIGLAVMFLMACYPKIQSPFGFAELIAQYQFLPSFSVNFFSLWLPVFELIVALGIVVTKWNREFTALMLIMMVMFIIALAQTLVRDLGVTCGCFDIEGAMDKEGAWVSLFRDLALMGPIIWLWIKGGNRYIWDFKG
ncbi:MauE/DoxX family redox-associated membrane protein [Fibrobacterota bacterium]